MKVKIERDDVLEREGRVCEKVGVGCCASWIQCITVHGKPCSISIKTRLKYSLTDNTIS